MTPSRAGKAPDMDGNEALLHKLHVHQIELEMQNEELRAAQLKLDISHARYFDLYDLAPVGYCTFSEKGVILETNLTAATLLGFVREEMLGQPCTRFLHSGDQDLFYRHRKLLFATGDPQSFELRMVKKDGSALWVRIQATYARDEAGLGQCRAVMSDISARKRDEERIAHLLAEKDLVLKETHHRVKNNMILISSLLQLQAGTLDDGKCKTILLDAAQRVQSMIVLYEQLYRSEDYRELRLKPFLESLIERIGEVVASIFPVEIETGIEDLLLDPKMILPLGILINELITNSIKYAFEGRESGRILVKASRSGNRAILEYLDDGVGIPEAVACGDCSGFGMQLVGMLVQQLSGEMRIEHAAGTKFTIEFGIR